MAPLSTFDQFFIDVNDILDNCNKKKEKMKVLDARKRAFGAHLELEMKYYFMN